MWPCILIIVLLMHNNRVDSETVCDFGFCGCKFHAINVIVDCAVGPKALESNLPLPNKTVVLDLSRSNLKYLQTSELLKSDALQELLLNYNNIHEINGNILQLPELKRLDLSNNNLEVIQPEVFSTIIKLEYLNLANNDLKQISPIRFHPLVNLKEIILDNNNVGADLEKISLFDRTGCGLTSDIQIISLSKINLGNLAPDYFRPSISLTNLTVSKNNLTLLFTLPYKLFYLDISDNPIKLLKLNDYVGPILSVLKANNLKIEEIRPYGLPGLFIELQFEGNTHLTKFSHLAFGKIILRDDFDFLVNNLSIRHSNISTLDETLWILFKKIDRLDLQHNPWICDCRLAWFLKLPIPQYLTEDLRCASPLHLNNTRIFDLDPEDFVCPQTRNDESRDYQIEVAAGVIVTLVCICIFIFFYFSRSMVNRKDYVKM